MVDVQIIFNMLKLEKDAATRADGLRLAREIEDLSLLILPPATPDVWECCAQVLVEKSDEALEPHLEKILEWIQDLNWPGALLILDRLMIFSGAKLRKYFINRVNYLKNLGGNDGLIQMNYLSELLGNKELKEELPESILIDLQKHYKN